MNIKAIRSELRDARALLRDIGQMLADEASGQSIRDQSDVVSSPLLKRVVSMNRRLTKAIDGIDGKDYFDEGVEG